MNICGLCKGYKLLCGRTFCPILRKLKIFRSIYSSLNLNREIFGSSPPSIFVGDKGYPFVKIAPLVPPIEGDTSELNNPLKWEDITLDKAIKMRSMLVMGEKEIHVKSRVDFDGLVLSIKPIDTEMVLKDKPKISIKLDEITPILNPKAKLEKLKLAENPKVPNFVERIVNDEIRAEEGIKALYKKGFDEYYIIRLLSAGLLGVKKRMVPTRWSITAVEDKIGEELKKEIVNFNPVDNFEIYFAEFLGNRYSILIIPSNYSFELMEVWLPNSIFGFSGVLRDYEFYRKRGYAKETSGAYYSARLSILEFLRRRRRQAKVIVFREITQNYYIPIGSWQIRVGVKKALDNKIGSFDNLISALNFLRSLLIHPLEDYIKRSEILKIRSLSEIQ